MVPPQPLTPSAAYAQLLVGISGHFTDRLQSALNAAARLVFSARRSEHITPLLRNLHWLRVPERIRFRLCVRTHRCLNGPAPPYLADGIRRAADVDGRRHLRSTVLVVPPVRRPTLGDRAFLLPLHGRGTVCRRPS